MARDFSTISPSARWLLLAKAHSGLPYARDVAAHASLLGKRLA